MSIIYWDFDGTLVKSNQLWVNCAYKSIEEILPNCNINILELKNLLLSKGFTWHTPEENFQDVIKDKWWDFIIKKISQDFITLGIEKSIADKAAKLVRKNILKKENYELYSDTIFTLKTLKESNHKNIILSNNFPELKDVICELGLSEYIDGYIISSIEGYDKPRIELFEIAKKSFNSNNKNTMYMIGDTEYADILGGNNAGMKTILVHRNAESKACYKCSNLRDIIDIVK